jgi:hypothetical protein
MQIAGKLILILEYKSIKLILGVLKILEIINNQIRINKINKKLLIAILSLMIGEIFQKELVKIKKYKNL